MIKKFALYENYEVEWKKSFKKFIIWYVPKDPNNFDGDDNILLFEIFSVYDSGRVELRLLYEYKNGKLKKLNYDKAKIEQNLLIEKDRLIYQSDDLNNCVKFLKNYGAIISSSRKYNL